MVQEINKFPVRRRLLQERVLRTMCTIRNDESVKILKIRMHSSRMHTARLLTVSQHALGRVGCIPACTGQGVSAQGCLPGGMSTWGLSAQGKYVCPGSVCLGAGVTAQGVCSGGGGMSAQEGVCFSICEGTHLH